MSKTIKQWLDTEVFPLERKGGKYLAELAFSRDPARPTLNCSNKFFSPADGIILFQKEVEADEAIIEVKGQFFTLKHLLQDKNFKDKALVISVFMTAYSVHYNRMPTSGYLTYECVDCLATNNLPMLAMEKDLLKGIVNQDNADYLFYNERRISRVFSPKMDYEYYIVQTADSDVNNIVHYCENGDWLQQTNKFGVINFGSQCTLVLPLPMPFNYKLCQKDHVVVEAGVDALIETDFQLFPEK